MSIVIVIKHQAYIGFIHARYLTISPGFLNISIPHTLKHESRDHQINHNHATTAASAPIHQSNRFTLSGLMEELSQCASARLYSVQLSRPLPSMSALLNMSTIFSSAS